VLSAPDGAQAALEVPWPPGPAVADKPVVAASVAASVAALAEHAARPRTALVVLVRRGGFAAGVARDGTLLASATGTRRVQGRTAAGGWSQQRYARRRDQQARVLAEAAADLVASVRGRVPDLPEVLVTGGDRTLIDDVLDDPRLRAAVALPRGPLLDVPDPRLDVLRDAARRARAVRVRLSEPV
jgi:hypothetical protein